MTSLVSLNNFNVKMLNKYILIASAAIINTYELRGRLTDTYDYHSLENYQKSLNEEILKNQGHMGMLLLEYSEYPQFKSMKDIVIKFLCIIFALSSIILFLKELNVINDNSNRDNKLNTLNKSIVNLNNKTNKKIKSVTDKSDKIILDLSKKIEELNIRVVILEKIAILQQMHSEAVSNIVHIHNVFKSKKPPPQTFSDQTKKEYFKRNILITQSQTKILLQRLYNDNKNIYTKTITGGFIGKEDNKKKEKKIKNKTKKTKKNKTKTKS